MGGSAKAPSLALGGFPPWPPLMLLLPQGRRGAGVGSARQNPSSKPAVECHPRARAGGDSLAQPLGCTVNRPRLCDLPRGENSSCRRPLPWSAGLEASYWPRSLGSSTVRMGGPPRRTLFKMSLFPGAPKTGLGLAGRQGHKSHLAPAFQISDLRSPPARGGSPWLLGRCHGPSRVGVGDWHLGPQALFKGDPCPQVAAVHTQEPRAT